MQLSVVLPLYSQFYFKKIPPPLAPIFIPRCAGCKRAGCSHSQCTQDPGQFCLQPHASTSVRDIRDIWMNRKTSKHAYVNVKDSPFLWNIFLGMSTDVHDVSLCTRMIMHVPPPPHSISLSSLLLGGAPSPKDGKLIDLLVSTLENALPFIHIFTPGTLALPPYSCFQKKNRAERSGRGAA